MDKSPLTYTVATGEDAGTIILTLIGPLILYNLFKFQDELRSIEAAVLIVDLEQMHYMDSAGLGLIVNAYVSSKAKGRRLILAGVSGRVGAMIGLTKLDEVLEIFPNVEEAERAVAPAGATPRPRPPHSVRIERGFDPDHEDASG